MASTTPSFAADGIEASASVVINYDRPIDWSSVADHIEFSTLGGETVDFTAEPQGDSAIVLKPTHELRFWGDYAVSVSNAVTATDGSSCDAVDLAFATLAPAEAPQPLRAAAINGAAQIDATHLLVASASHRSMQVYDISNASTPTLVSETPTKQTPVSVAVDGDRAYVPSAAWGILVYDISIPESPELVGVAGTPGVAVRAIPFQRNGTHYLAVADATGGLRIIDVTVDDGAKDVWTGFTVEGIVSIAMEGNLLAAVDTAGHFDLIDLSDPKAPVLLSQNSTTAVDDTFNYSLPANDVALVGNTLVVSQSYAGFESFDVSDPAAPLFKNEILGPQGKCAAGCPDSLQNLSAQGTQVFAASAMTGGVRLDVASDGTISIGATLAAPGRINTVAVANGSLFVGGDAGFAVFDSQSPDGSAPVYEEKNGWGIDYGLAFANDHLYVSSGSRGLETNSLADPLAPSPIDLEPTPGVERDSGLVDVAVQGDLILVADGRAGFSLFDAENASKPISTAAIAIPDQAGRVLTIDHYAYSCSDNAGIAIVDIADPANPQIVDQVTDLDPIVGGCKDLALIGNHLYFAGGTGLAVLDASSPATPTLVNHVTLPAGDLVLSLAHRQGHDDRLFATTYVQDWEGTHYTDQRFLVFDISDPVNPVRTYRSEDLGGARAVTVIGDKAFIAGTADGVRVYDVSDPDMPFYEGGIATRGSSYRALLGNDTLYVTEAGGGIGAIHVGALNP